VSWNGYTVIDMDAHIRERADRFYKDYIDPEYRGAYQQLCEAIAKQEAKGERYSLFGSRNSVIEQIETGRPLGVRDTFGMSRRSEMEHGRIAFPPGRKDPPAATNPGGSELGCQSATRGHGPGVGRHERAFPDACIELLRVARLRLRERALSRLSPMGRRFLRASAKTAEMDRRRQYARRAVRCCRNKILG
jgi:hypothetical protein